MRRSFTARIFIGTVVMQVAMVGLLAWSGFHLIGRGHADLFAGYVEQQSLLLETALLPGLAYRDPAVLQDLLNLTADQPDLRFAVVFDDRGRRLAAVGELPESFPGAAGLWEDGEGLVGLIRRVELAGQPLGTLIVGYSTARMDAITATLLRHQLGLGLVILGLTSLAALVFALAVTRRLRQLRRGADLYRTGKLQHRIPLGVPDEIGEVAASLNTLAQDLHASQRALQRHNLELNRTVDRMEALLRGAEALLWEADPTTGEWRYVKGDYGTILDLNELEVTASGVRLARVHPDDLPGLQRTYAAAGSSPRPVDYRYRGNEADWRWLRDLVSRATNGGGVEVLRGLTLDITGQKEATLAFARSEARYQEVIEHVSEVVFRMDAEKRWSLLNPAWQEMTGFGIDESLGLPVLNFVAADDHDEMRAFCSALLNGARLTSREEIRIRAKDGGLRWVSFFARASHDAGGRVTAVFGTLADITERKQAEDEVRRLAFYDSLTGLPNRSLLRDRLHQSMALAARTGHHGAVLFLDLDNFKDINDTLGHESGDMLLRLVSSRMRTAVREADTLARLGGDEFVMILNELHVLPARAASQAEGLARKLIALLSDPFRLGELERHCTPSIGITLFSDAHTTVDELLRQADLAMYRAKDTGRNTLCFFQPELQHAVRERAALEADFRRAKRENAMFLHYQAHQDVHGQICGAEVLLRWHHPERGLVPPADFIPVAEQTGLILDLGRWVLADTCEQLARWAGDPLFEALGLAVNVSVKQFRHPDFVQDLKSILERTGAPASRLMLELTESTLLEDTDAVIERMRLLGNLGVRFALDDFGTGYSSLSYLKQLPLSVVKIDQSFVRDILVDSNDAVIAEMIINLSKTLGLDVIAEGVETEEQRDFLLRLGCTEFQGYLVGRPASREVFEQRILGARTGTAG